MMVVLVFVDYSRRLVSVPTAWELCGDPTTAGKIVDALTEDRELQDRLRLRMDNSGT